MAEWYALERLIKEAPHLRSIFRTIQERQDISLAVIFGSYAKGTADRKSDIDLSIEMNDREVKRELERSHSRLSVKIGPWDPENLLIQEIAKTHVIVKGVERFYEKTKFLRKRYREGKIRIVELGTGLRPIWHRGLSRAVQMRPCLRCAFSIEVIPKHRDREGMSPRTSGAHAPALRPVAPPVLELPSVAPPRTLEELRSSRTPARGPVVLPRVTMAQGKPFHFLCPEIGPTGRNNAYYKCPDQAVSKVRRSFWDDLIHMMGVI